MSELDPTNREGEKDMGGQVEVDDPRVDKYIEREGGVVWRTMQYGETRYYWIPNEERVPERERSLGSTGVSSAGMASPKARPA